MDRKLVFATDFWVDHRDTDNRSVIWYEVYQEKMAFTGGNYEFKYIIEKCIRKHDPSETYSFADPLYCLSYLDSAKTIRQPMNNIIYNEPAAVNFASQKIRLMRKRKTVQKLIERQKFMEKISNTNNFFKKYIEE